MKNTSFFAFPNKHNVPVASFSFPESKSRLLRLVGLSKANGFNIRNNKDIVIKVSNNIVRASVKGPFDSAKGIWNIEISCEKVGNSKVSAFVSDAEVASLKVEVIRPEIIKLPASDSKKGLMTRLFLVECLSPENGAYNAVQVYQSMKWMRLVIYNRLNSKNPGRFLASQGDNNEWDIFDIVRAPRQFEGFENYPQLLNVKGVDLNKKIRRILDISNDYSDTRRVLYSAFVNNALAVAANSFKVKDPSPSGLYGWRTKGSRHPGGDYVKYKDLAGQTFYTLK